MKIKEKSPLLFSCETRNYKSVEQLTQEHSLVKILTGEMTLHFHNKSVTLSEGDIAVVKKNEFVKAQKKPDSNKIPYQSITVFFSQEMLTEYSHRNRYEKVSKYAGNPYVVLKNKKFIHAYFDSLLPYFDQPEKLSSKIASLKAEEAIELLLDCQLAPLLFDFTVPHKIDLEKFMNEHFIFNIPIREFARLTGRSLSTFKRDFKTIYKNTPEVWLRERRLEEAQHLLKSGQKPTEVYYAVGFKNLSHFSVSYKHKFGKNASEEY